MAVKQSRSTEDWEREIGAQVRRARLAADIDQASLAARANISLSALKKLEAGTGSTLRTLVRTLRALGREDWLSELHPEPPLSPIALARAIEGARGPQRASRRRGNADGLD